MMNAAIFLDRDNTLIHNDGDLGDPALVKLIQGAASAIASLRGLHYKIVVVTNQGGVARGKYSEEDVQKTNQRVADLIKAASGAAIDRFYYCPYHPKGSVPQYTMEHPWRKPAPGMLLQAAQDLQIDLSQSWMIGDQLRDVQAGASAGTRCILLSADQPSPPTSTIRHDQLQTGYVEVSQGITHFTAKSLIEAVRIIAKHRKPEAELPVQAVRTKEPVEKSKQPTQADRSTAEVNPPEPPPAVAVAMAAKPAPPAAQPAPPASISLDRSSPTSPSVAVEQATGVSTDQASHALSSVAAWVEPVLPVPMATAIEPAMSVAPAPVERPTSQAQATGSMLPEQEKPPVDLEDRVRQDELEQEGASSGRLRPPSMEVTLRQILQELRGQRTVQSDFSFLRMFAIVLQILAGFLLLAGLFLGAQDADLFMRWMATAILVQLATIALLLLDR